MKRIESYLSALQRAGNLDLNQAKTIVYYCVMTHSEKPKKRPILNICGESGTGKTGIQRQVLPWCNGSKWINARNKTAAQIRDDLADVSTAVIEEVDKTLQPRECENWIQQRYDEGGICVTYKRPPAFTSEDHNHFGYTIVHTQNAFKCIELDRRTIRIPIFKDSQRPYKISEGLDGKVLAVIAQEVDWEREIVQPVSNSAWDAWLPLMRIAAHIGDDEFLEYARKQIEEKTEEDDLTKVFEPKGIVLSEIIPIYEIAVDTGHKHISFTSLRAVIKDRGYDFSEKEIVSYAKALGFTVVYPHNKAHLKVEGLQRLHDIYERAGFKQNNLEEIDTILKATRVSSYANQVS